MVAVASAAAASIAVPAPAAADGDGAAIGAKLGSVNHGGFGTQGAESVPKDSRQGVPTGAVVQRYAAAVGYRVNVRSAPTLRTKGTIVAKLPGGTPLKGSYNSTGYWFKVAEGPWSGRWLAASLVQKTSDARVVNGKMPVRELAPLPAGSLRRAGSPSRTALSPAAAHAFADMNAAFRARFGHDIGVVEGYRTLATQQLYAKRFGYPRAAVPGTSNHGLGNAVDIGESGRPATASPFYFGHVYDRWLTQNGWKWGFDRPSFMDAGGSNPEFWHYNFVG